MAKFTKSLFLATSALGLASLFAGSAQAASIANVTLTGDAILYDYSANPNDGTPLTSGFSEQNLIDALGNTNNIELDGSTAHSGADSFSSGSATQLKVSFDDGTSIIFSSLTAGDWDSLYDTWFEAGWASDNVNDDSDSNFREGIAETATNVMAINFYKQLAKTELKNGGIQARLSDPNLFSVSKDGDNVSFSLAGHLEGQDRSDGVMVRFSEIIKYSINGGDTWDYKYAFGAADSESGVRDNDTVGSHDGLYSFNVEVPGGVTVPEPASVLGLMAVGSLIASRKRK